MFHNTIWFAFHVIRTELISSSGSFSRDEPAPLALPGIFVEGFRLSCCTFSGLSDLQAGRRRCFSFYAAKLQKASAISKFSRKLSDAFTFFNIWEVEGGMRQNFDSFLRFEETPCHALGVCQNERNALPRSPLLRGGGVRGGSDKTRFDQKQTIDNK